MSQPTTSIGFSPTTPAAPTGDQNAVPQSDNGQPLQKVSFYAPKATASLRGTVKPDGTTTQVDASGNMTAKTMVGDTGSGGAAGIVPAPPAGSAAAGKFLKADATFAVPAIASPLTTKGDLFGHSTVDARVPVGTDGQAIVADSTQTLGLKWADRLGCITIVFDGAGNALTAAVGAPYDMDPGGTIIGWSAIADQAGSFSMDICFHAGSARPAAPPITNTTTDKISASAPITMSSAQSASGGTTAVSTWTRALSQYGSLLPNLTSVSTCKRITVQIFYTKS